MTIHVLKRNGNTVPFDAGKILAAIQKAFNACNTPVTDDILQKLVMRVESKILTSAKAQDDASTGNIPVSVETIQDYVIYTLSECGFAKVAIAYSTYRNRHNEARDKNHAGGQLVQDFLDEGVAKGENGNASVADAFGSLILSNSEKVTRDYFLNYIYDEDIKKAHENRSIHIHDLGLLCVYCCGWSLKQLIQEGIKSTGNSIACAPASHLATLCNQMVNFLGIMQNEASGAQAFSSVDTYLAPFVRVDNLSYHDVKKCMESLVFGLNIPSRWGSQCPFSNFTFDWVCPPDLKYMPAIVGGKEQDFTYGDCQKEIDMINKAFLEVMIAGDAEGRGFEYPIPTYSITRDFDWSETENNKLLFEMTAKYGTPYFSNYINSDMDPSDVRAMAILGTQNVIYRDVNGRVSKNEIRHLVNLWLKAPNGNKPKYEMLMNGKFVPVTEMFKIPYKNYKTYVTIKFSNGIEQNFSYDHKCYVVRDGREQVVLAQNVKATDKMLLARHAYDTPNGNYQAGRITGIYLAEGWICHNGANLRFAINEERNDIVTEIKEFFNPLGCRVTINHDEPRHVFMVDVFGHAAVAFVHDYITGERATTKRLSALVWDMSANFRNGIYDGYLDTDGCKKAGVYAHTTNRKLCRDLIELAASIGKTLKYQVNENNTRYFKPDKSDIETFTSYKLLLASTAKEYSTDFYSVDVVSVKEQDAARVQYVYNFTVDTPEHLYTLPNGLITHQCCRLRLNLRELRRKAGGNFGAGEKTGSVGVVTINLPQLAYLSEDKEDFYKRLDSLMDIAARSLSIKRNTITSLLERNLYPYIKAYLGSFDDHFSTIGLVGMNEACLNAKWLKKDIKSPEGKAFAEEVLDHMRERLSDYQEKYEGTLFNLEATPAESTAYRFAKWDKEHFPTIVTAGMNGTPYYTNSSHLPVNSTPDIFEALDHQDSLQTRYTSGTVFHAFLGERLPDWKSAMKLVRNIAENYHLPYYTMSPTYSVCKEHGYLKGEQGKCPVCGKPTEIYSRITGYYRPVQNWNNGKTQEFYDRRTYTGLERKPAAEPAPVKEEVTDKPALTIITTRTCPKCKQLKKILDDEGYAYKEILADSEEGMSVCEKEQISEAPTVLYDGNKYSQFKILDYLRGTHE